MRQFIARVNLVCAAQPELDFPPLDAAAARRCVARALHGVMTVKEAQGTPLKDAFHRHLAPEQLAWLDELAPLTIPWHDGRALKLLYTGIDEHGDGAPGAEAQVKLHECFPLKEHPRVCEGRAPVRLWLCAPEGKRLEFRVRRGWFGAAPPAQGRDPGCHQPELSALVLRKLPALHRTRGRPAR